MFAIRQALWRMRSFVAHLSVGLSTALTYRWSVLTSVLSLAVSAVASVFLWRAVLSSESGHLDVRYDEGSITSYFLLSTAVAVLYPSSTLFRLARLLHSGRLNYELARPQNFVVASLAWFLSARVVEGLVVGLVLFPLSVVGLARLSVPSFVDVVFLLLSGGLFFAFGLVVGTLCFWLVEMWPLQPLYAGLMALAGGRLFPLDLMPDPLGAILTYSPFGLFGFLSVKTLGGTASAEEVHAGIVAALVWTLLLYALWQVLWPSALSRFEAMEN